MLALLKNETPVKTVNWKLEDKSDAKVKSGLSSFASSNTAPSILAWRNETPLPCDFMNETDFSSAPSNTAHSMFMS